MTWLTRGANGWTTVYDPYVRTTQSWNKVNQGFVFENGQWVRFFNRDIDHPAAPTLALTALGTVYISSEITGSTSDAVKVSLWIAYGYTPSTIEGSSNQVLAKVPYDYTTGLLDVRSWNLTPGLQYWATAVVYDITGNRSPTATDSVLVPAAPVAKTAYVDPVGSKSWRPDISDWRVTSDVYQGGSTLHKGCWFYGDRLDKINYGTIKNMQIKIARENTNHGIAGASNVWLAHHENKSRPNGNPGTMRDATKVGTLTRGQSKWFDVPKSWWSGFENANPNYNGLGLYTTVGGENNVNHIITHAASDNVASGRVYVEWEE